MAEQSWPPQTVSAVMRLAGTQPTSMNVYRGGSPDAYIAISIARSVIYMQTSATTDRLGEIWRDAQIEALQLPRERHLAPARGEPPNAAQPSLVVHTTGQPGGSVRLTKTNPKLLNITIGDMAFVLADQKSFHSCVAPFLAAMETGAHICARSTCDRWPR